MVVVVDLVKLIVVKRNHDENEKIHHQHQYRKEKQQIDEEEIVGVETWRDEQRVDRRVKSHQMLQHARVPPVYANISHAPLRPHVAVRLPSVDH